MTSKIKPICRMPECGRPINANGFCWNHLQRSKRAAGYALQSDDVIDTATQLLKERPLSAQQLADALGCSMNHAHHVAIQAGASVLFKAVVSDAHNNPSNIYSCLHNSVAHWLSMIQQHLVKRPELSSKELAMLCGLSPSTMRDHLKYLHAANLVHVGRWTTVWQQKERLYVFGPGKDAPKPEPFTREEIAKRYRQRCKTDPEALANRRAQNLRAYHRRNSKPKRDPLVAAMFGDAA